MKSYTRRTKSGKTVTVRAYTADYDAKETTKKKGAGDELKSLERQKRAEKVIPEDDVEFDTGSRPIGSGTNGPVPKKKEASSKEPKKTSAKSSEPSFTVAEFKEWYNGTGSAADKKVAKALRAQLGRSGYHKLEDEAIDNYSSRGHLSMFKRVSGGNNSAIGTKKTPKMESPSQASERVRNSIKGYNDLKKAGWKSVSRKNDAPRAREPMRYLVSPDGTQEVQYRIVEPKNKWEPKGYVLMGKPSKVKETSSKKTTAPTTSKRIKMPDKVREKKRKLEEYLRKVKESGMSIDEYNRLH